MAFSQLLGAKLVSKDGEVATDEALSGKTAVGIYFSAHWCPPCRGFTPKLAQMYNDTFKGKGMEIVFASSDRDEGAFGEYFAEMPWLALPFSERELKEKLSKKYKVQGIPSFVILGPDGNIITTDGRAAVMKDPEGTKYPWVPPTPQEKAKLVHNLLGSELVQKAGGKPIGIYFSAHWCPPCRGFTPKLAEFYRNGLKDKMEIIFVSSDRSQSDFDEYFGEMPWLALPFDKRKEKEELSDAFGVNGIPSFVVIDADGMTITTDGRSKVVSDPKGEAFPDGWLPQPCNMSMMIQLC
jgi:nucleoredoxin